jgi:hypothetical protein
MEKIIYMKMFFQKFSFERAPFGNSSFVEPLVCGCGPKNGKSPCKTNRVLQEALKIVFAVVVSFFPVLSCKTAAPPPEGVPVEEAAPAVTNTPAAEKPAPPPVQAEEPAFDPESITQEMHDSAKNEVKEVIEELNRICTEAGKSASAERSYNAWLAWLTDEYAERTKDPNYLAFLSQQPALKSRNIELDDQKGYFINVFAASRQNVRFDDIEFTAPRRVKVWGLEYEEKSVPSSRKLQQDMLDQGYELVKIRNQNRMVRTKKIRYYVLEKIDDKWKIASLDDD